MVEKDFEMRILNNRGADKALSIEAWAKEVSEEVMRQSC